MRHGAQYTVGVTVGTAVTRACAAEGVGWLMLRVSCEKEHYLVLLHDDQRLGMSE